MVVRLDVLNSPELQAIILAVRASKKEIAKAIRQQTKKVVAPEWQRAVAERSESLLESRVLVATATALVSNQNVKLRSASKGRKLSGGLDPKTQYHVAEYGGDREDVRPVEGKSRKGKTYKIPKRHTKRQLRPRKKAGYVFGPSVADMVPRIASLWTQTVVRVFAEALEGKSNGS